MIWAIEWLSDSGWKFCDFEFTRQEARMEMEVIRALHKDIEFRIRKYVRAD